MKEPWKGALQAGCLTGFLLISLFLMHASIKEPEGVVYGPMEGRDALKIFTYCEKIIAGRIENEVIRSHPAKPHRSRGDDPPVKCLVAIDPKPQRVGFCMDGCNR